MNPIVEATPLDEAKVYLRFQDGTAGELSLAHLAGKGVFAKLADPTVFAEVAIDESGGLCWGDEIDLCPDALYLRLTSKSAEEVFGQAEPIDAGP